MMMPPVFPSFSAAIAAVWPANQTRDANVLIRPKQTTTKLWPSSVCKTPTSGRKDEDDWETTKVAAAKTSTLQPVVQDTILLVIVCSALGNFAERQSIRDSWASEPGLTHVKVIFLVGHVGNDTSALQVNVTHESDKFGDILQEDFIDNYSNLTVKSLMLLKWYVQECSNVPYALKTDDDVYVNLRQLYKLVSANKKPNLLTGSLICEAHPIRDPYNKWYVPDYLYDRKKFPNYLSGTAYLMSRSTASTLFDAALVTPVFHLEDIYVTGLLSEAAGIRPKDHIGFSYVKRSTANACLYAQTISSHHLTISEMKDIYPKVMQKGTKCAPIKRKYLRNYGPGKCSWSSESQNAS